MNQNHRVFSLASILLQYPSKDLKTQLDELVEEVSLITDVSIQGQMKKFLNYFNETSYEELCLYYVSTFDFSERTTLFLTYSVFKDNRERGPALVKLRQEFLNAGADLESDELPDYLPLILEFASITEPEKSRKILSLHLRAIERLELELEALNSHYTSLLTAIVSTIKQQLRDDNNDQLKERKII